MAKKSTAVLALPKTLPDALEELQELRASIKDRDEEIEKLQGEKSDALEELRKELEADHAESLENVERTALHEFEIQDALVAHGGHQNCLDGAITGNKLHPLCTCGWNYWATLLEQVHNGGI